MPAATSAMAGSSHLAHGQAELVPAWPARSAAPSTAGAGRRPGRPGLALVPAACGQTACGTAATVSTNESRVTTDPPGRRPCWRRAAPLIDVPRQGLPGAAPRAAAASCRPVSPRVALVSEPNEPCVGARAPIQPLASGLKSNIPKRSAGLRVPPCDRPPGPCRARRRSALADRSGNCRRTFANDETGACKMPAPVSKVFSAEGSAGLHQRWARRSAPCLTTTVAPIGTRL